MRTLKIDMLKFAGAKKFTAKDGTDFIAIPIDANAIFQGKQGAYLSLTLMDNRDGADQYGNEGFATIDLGKERRLAGEKGPILGNWKTLGQSGRSANQNTAPPPRDNGAKDFPDDDDSIPFACPNFLPF